MFCRCFWYLVVIGSTIQLSTKMVCFFSLNYISVLLLLYRATNIIVKDHSCWHLQKLCAANNRPSRGCVILAQIR